MFFATLACAALGVLSPPLALAGGIAVAAIFSNPFERQSAQAARLLLQWSIVGLGFGIDFGALVKAGRTGFVYTAVSIALAFALGLLLGRALKVKSKASLLIAAGTAICGGSAIAAIAPIIAPNKEELGTSLGTVFALNSLALLLFPAIGFWLHLTQPQFGLWCALAIHDTSSVVGAAARFGPQALAVGTTVKLMRALWIIPVALLTAVLNSSKAKVRLPWFVLFFCAAAFSRSSVPSGAALFSALAGVGHAGLAVTLFLIGTGLKPALVRRAGPRMLLQASLLWIVVATFSLLLIRAGWIAI